VRIALLTESLTPDRGWGRYAAELLKRLPAQGFDVEVFETSARASRHLPWHHREPFLTLDHGYSVMQQVAQLRKRVAGCRLIHALTERLAPVAALVAGGRPFVFNAYGTFATRPLARRFRRPFAAAIYRRAARIACISHYTEGRIQALLPGVRTTVVPSGVDYDRFQSSRERHSDVPPTILTVGAVKPRKGHHILLEAFARVRMRLPDARWHVAGNFDFPDYAAMLRRRITELGLTDAVAFLGRTDERTLIQEYHRCAVFALPSVNVGDAYEGYPLVFAEAGACGKPVLGTTGNGSEEAIQDGVNGLLVPQADVDATTGALLRLLTDTGLAASLGSRGRDRARQLTWDRTSERFADIYRDLAPTAPPL
jgi:phosphatidyl-myo-inositol dimannoside synthase